VASDVSHKPIKAILEYTQRYMKYASLEWSGLRAFFIPLLSICQNGPETGPEAGSYTRPCTSVPKSLCSISNEKHHINFNQLVLVFKGDSFCYSVVREGWKKLLYLPHSIPTISGEESRLLEV
jgi:hypothetical protein